MIELCGIFPVGKVEMAFGSTRYVTPEFPANDMKLSLEVEAVPGVVVIGINFSGSDVAEFMVFKALPLSILFKMKEFDFFNTENPLVPTGEVSTTFLKLHNCEK